MAEAGRVAQKDLHFDLEAICKAYEAIKPIAARLGVEAPQPRLAEFTYTHIAALGARIVFTQYEPKPEPLIRSPEEIDTLQEPENYLETELIRERLRISAELKRLFPQTPLFIGHFCEGPITTATLLLGQQFLTLPYDDPARAHRLLQFCVTSARNFTASLKKHFGEVLSAFISGGFPDDFAGMFGPNLFSEFVVPYWEQLYESINAGQRMLHSELLRMEHLRFLKEARIDYFDPGVDQYLPPEVLRACCPTKFQCRIREWEVYELDTEALAARYRYLAGFGPYSIMFQLTRLQDENKIKALLEVARELEQQR